jgi:adenine phosphoribosyltransferase
MSLSEVFEKITVVKDFPKKGITFRHIGPLLKDTKLFKYAINQMFYTSDTNYDIVCGLDARGFIIATAIQDLTGIPQVMIRKQSKLPGKKYTYEYKKEYGSDIMELEYDSIIPGQKVLIVDDLMATAGTLTAAINLVEQAGGIVTGVMVLIEFKDLNGRQKLKDYKVHSLFSLDSNNDKQKLDNTVDTLKIVKYINSIDEVPKEIVNVYVASCNKVKLQAVYEAIHNKSFLQSYIDPSKYNYNIHGVDGICSGIPEQPLTVHETTQGALNRIHECIKLVNSDKNKNKKSIFVSIENGIMKGDSYSDFPIVAYKVFNNNIYITNSIKSMVTIPVEYNKYIEESINSDRTITFGSIIEKKIGTKDWHKFVCGTSRKDLIILAMEQSGYMYIRKQAYGNV